MNTRQAELPSLVDRLMELKAEAEQIRREQDQIEAELLKQAEADLKDTKRKTVSYQGQSGKVTATMAQSLKVTYPSYLQKIFGCAYGDAVTVETRFKLSAPATRMMAGIWTDSFVRMSVAQIVSELPCSDAAKRVLQKKLKGAKYESDRKSLIEIGGLSEQEASDCAYLVSEAAVWEEFTRMLKATGQGDDERTIQEARELIAGAVVVVESPKITIEPIEAG